MSRLNSKDIYTKELFRLFKIKGLRLSMDEISQYLGITKKTLYNNFSSRLDMQKSVARYFFDTLENKINESSRASSNAIEQMINLSKTIRRELDKLSIVLLDDLIHEKSDLFLDTERSGFYHKIIRENILEGIEEGLYRKDLNVDYAVAFYTTNIESFYKKENWARFFKNSSEFHMELVKHHLYAIVSNESRVLLDSYLK